MPISNRHSSRAGRARAAGLLALLSVCALAGCATDELAQAPSAPNRPWTIPAAKNGAIESPENANDQSSQGGAGSLAALLPGLAAPSFDLPWVPKASLNFSGQGAARVDANRVYDLPGLIDLAQRSNPETREAWERARQAALAVGLVDSAYLPQISAEVVAGYQHTTLPIPANLVPGALFTADTRELLPTLAVKWLLFDFGRRAGAEKAARAESFVSNVAFTGAHQKLIFAVSRDYFALGAARGRLRVAEEALSDAQVVQDAVEARRKNGLATTVEVAQALRQAAEARFNLARATGSERSAYQALIASMGIAPGTAIKVADNSSQILPQAPTEAVDKFVEDAMANRPDVIAALGKVRAAEGKLDQARADYRPTIALVGQGYQNIGALSVQGGPYYSVNKPSGNIMLRLSWPLFDGGMRDAQMGIARSAVAAARDEVDQTKNAAVKQVSDAYDAVKTTLAEHAAAGALQEAAQAAHDAALDSYRHGVGTYTDLVNDQTALTRAGADLEDAHANVLTAAAALAFATGFIASDRAL